MVRHSEQVCITLESVSKSPDGITKVRGVRSLNICPIISGGTTAIAAGIALAVPETEEIGVYFGGWRMMRPQSSSPSAGEASS